MKNKKANAGSYPVRVQKINFWLYTGYIYSKINYNYQYSVCSHNETYQSGELLLKDVATV